MGRFERAMEQIDRAIVLNPVSPAIGSTKGLVYYYSGRVDEAIGHYLQIIEREPSFAMAHLFLGEALAETGALGESIREVETAIQLSGGSPQMMAARGYSHALAGDLERAQQALADLIEQSETRYVSRTAFARIFTGMDDKDSALFALEEAFATQASNLVWIALHPAFRRLHSEPRWIRLLERIGVRTV